MDSEMDRVRQIAHEIIRREGGFVDDPADAGGATKHGVSLRYARSIGLDLDNDGDTDADDIRLVDADKAIDLFVDEFFRRPGIARLPQELWPHTFDHAVHAGPHAAVTALQTVLTEGGFPLGEIDGVLGAMTARAALRAVQEGYDVVSATAIHRREHAYLLAEMNPRNRRFVERQDGGKGGWITRAESFMEPRFRIDDAAHRERLAA